MSDECPKLKIGGQVVTCESTNEHHDHYAKIQFETGEQPDPRMPGTVPGVVVELKWYEINYVQVFQRDLGPIVFPGVNG